MSATIALKPTIMRATSIFASAVQAGLMGAGVVLVAVLFNIYHGDVRVLDALQSRMLPDTTQSASDVEDMTTLAAAETQTVSLSGDSGRSASALWVEAAVSTARRITAPRRSRSTSTPAAASRSV